MPNTTLLLAIVFDLGGYIKIDTSLTGFTIRATCSSFAIDSKLQPTGVYPCLSFSGASF
jgi:hypothetical protein